MRPTQVIVSALAANSNFSASLFEVFLADFNN